MVFYAGQILILLLGIKFIYELIKGRKNKYLKSLRHLLNFSIFLTWCLGAFLSLALIVRPLSEITQSKIQSLENLNQWILKEILEIGLFGSCTIIILGLLNYIYQRKIEKTHLVRPIINITIANFIILFISLFIIYNHTYHRLAIDVGHHFK